MKIKNPLLATLGFLCLFIETLHAQVPQLVNYQGRVAVGTVNFQGTGSFRFALVNAAGTTTYWRNAADTTPADGVPDSAVSLAVNKGLYSVLLGDTSVANMGAIPASVWANPDVRLRVWFNDGANGNQLLTPDQRLAPNGYLPTGTVTADKIAAGAVGTAQLAAGAVGSAQLAAGAVGSAQLAVGATAAPAIVAGTAQAAAANTSYVATSGSSTTFALPVTANVGDLVQITGAGAGGWTAVSTNGQVEWTARTNGLPASTNWKSVASSADGSRLVAAASFGKIYTSSDYGEHWTVQTSGLPTDSSWVSVVSSADGIYLGALDNSHVYTSANAGLTWIVRTNGLPGVLSATSLTCTASGSSLFTVGNNGECYGSTNYGANWLPRDNGLNSNAFLRAGACSADEDLFVIVGFNQIYTSRSQGSAWSADTSGWPANANWQSVASSSNGSKVVAVASGGGIYTATASGRFWTQQTNGVPTGVSWTSVASSADGNRLVAVASDGKSYASTDSGVNWTLATTGLPANIPLASVVSSSDGYRLCLAANGAIYTSGSISQVSGAQGTVATLQYLGSGNWSRVGQTGIAAGSVGSGQLTPGLTLGGVTTGSFSGNLTGNASTAASATNFTGSMAGDVTGPQSATVVAAVGGVTAANVASGANLANAATNANTGSALVKRDASGNFTAGTITANGSALTSLNATNISSGTLADARLSANIPRLNTNNTFTNSFTVGSTFNVTPPSGNTGTGSLFVGNGSGQANTTGTQNTALGGEATLSSNATGSQNVALGAFSMNANTTGSYNSGLGMNSLRFSNGDYNTASGFEALTSNTTGNNNTALGSRALRSSSTGSDNIAIGYQSGLSLTGSNNIAIGHLGVAGESNIIRIGTPGTQTDTYLSGIIHGDGSGLTNVGSASLAAGSVTSTKLASGLTLGGTTSGTFSGNGAALTNLNAASLSTGTVADARLSSNIPRLNAVSNTFTGTQTLAANGLTVGGTQLVASGSNIGIGTASPQATLHVNGSVAFEGAIRVPGAGIGTNKSAFIHKATAGNSYNISTTVITNAMCDNDPNAILIVTQNLTPPGITGAYNNNVIGVYYVLNKWTIFNQNGAAIAGAAFNVLVIKP